MNPTSGLSISQGHELMLRQPSVHRISLLRIYLCLCTLKSSVSSSFQRRQADAGGRTSLQIVRAALENEGFVAGLYRGFGTTVLREVPFSLIQFPLWELFKKACPFETAEITPAAKSGTQFNRKFLDLILPRVHALSLITAKLK